MRELQLCGRKKTNLVKQKELKIMLIIISVNSASNIASNITIIIGEYIIEEYCQE